MPPNVETEVRQRTSAQRLITSPMSKEAIESEYGEEILIHGRWYNIQVRFVCDGWPEKPEKPSERHRPVNGQPRPPRRATAGVRHLPTFCLRPPRRLPGCFHFALLSPVPPTP